MTNFDSEKHALKHIAINAAKLPLVLFLIGAACIAIAYLNAYHSFVPWPLVVNLADQVGFAFTTIAIMTFIYQFIVLTLQHYEDILWKEKRTTFSLMLSIIRKGLRVIFLLVIINVLIKLLGDNGFYLSVINNVINAIIILSVGWIVLQIFRTSETVFYQKMLLSPKEYSLAKARYTRIHILRNIATVLVIAICIAVILMSYQSFRNIGISLLASAGVLTAIIGLAAQRTLASLFTGLQLVLTQTIKIGDVVVFEKQTGIVEEITLSCVILKLGDRRHLVIPINHFIDKPFENWTHEGDCLRSSISFSVDFMMPIGPLRAELDNILANSLYWDKTAKSMQVSDWGEHAIEITIQLSAANADNLGDLRAEVREKILDYMRTNYPQFFPNLRLVPEQRALLAP
jgi:small-conductance mechanosensitive channel